jgi:hypothetical protein
MTLPAERQPQPGRTLVLRPPARRRIAMLGAMLGLAALCLFAVFAGWTENFPIRVRGLPAWLLLGAAFFGAGAVWYALQLHPRACSLTLSRDGFEVRSSFRSRVYPWSRVRRFRSGVIGSGIASAPWVGFDLLDATHGGLVGRAPRPDLVDGANALFAEFFGVPPRELAELLEAWQRHHAP